VRAARIHAWGGPPVVEEVTEPSVGPDESLVAVVASAVAHIDVTVATGTFAHRPSLPYVPGTEGAGRIVRSGRFARGAMVRIRGGGVGLTRDGTCAQLVAVPDAALWPLPEAVDPAVAATFFSPCVTAHAALHAVGGMREGQRIAVAGASGAVGSIAVQLALKAEAVEAIDVARDGTRTALRPGGERVVLTADERCEADLLIDMTGGDGLARRVLDTVRSGGRAVLVGYAAGTHAAFDLPALLAADVALLPMNLIRRAPELANVADDLLRRIAAGELILTVMRLPLEDAADALARVAAGAARGRTALLI
jgi:NADPH:quinone reductase